jgi:hypothetical protein
MSSNRRDAICSGRVNIIRKGERMVKEGSGVEVVIDHEHVAGYEF